MGLSPLLCTLPRRTKQQMRYACAVVIIVFFVYYVAFPFAVGKFALPLFCNEETPCQNQSVSLYSHVLASDRVASCHFTHEHDYAVVILGMIEWVHVVINE